MNTFISRSLWRVQFLLIVLMFATVLVACGGGSGGGEPSASADSYVLTVEKTGDGMVTSNPAGIACGAACSASFTTATVVTLSATPGASQTFSGWSGDCAGSASSCVVTVDQARTVRAMFAPAAGQTNYTLTVSVLGTGTVASQPAGINCTASNCTAAFAADTVVALTAIPAAGQSFTGWSGACSGAASSCQVTMNQLRTVSAGFAPTVGTNAILSVSLAGSGSVASSPAGISCGATCTASFAINSQVVLTANPAVGQVFSSWGGACSGTTTTCSLQMSQARAVQAVFAASPSAAAFQAPSLIEDLADYNVARLASLLNNAGLDAMVAVSPNGNTAVMWEQSDGTPNNSTYKAWMRRYLTGSGWQAPETVPGLTASSLRSGMISGSLLIDDAGRVTWLKGGTGIVARRYTPGSGWAIVNQPAAISPYFTDLLQALMDAQGNIGILIRVGSVGMYNATLQVGGGWTTPARLDQRAAGLSYAGGDIALSSNGNAIAIWAQENPGGGIDDLVASRYTPAGGWSTPQVIETGVGDVQSTGSKAMRMVMDAQGNGIAMWQQGNELHYNIYREGSGWQGAVRFETISSSSSISNSFIRLEMNEAGQAVATWFAGVTTFRSMSYSPATGWSAISDITETPIAANHLSMASANLGLTADGRAYLVGQGLLVSTPTYRVKQHGGVWGSSTNLVTGISGVENVYFTMNRTGQGIVVWSRDDQLNVNTRNSLWSSLLR